MMTDQREPALATLPKCPEWCTKDSVVGNDQAVRHLHVQGEDGRGRMVFITQTDSTRSALDDLGGQWRGKASIAVVYTNGVREFDLTDLTPEQGYALATLVGRAGNERLASLLLDAVELLKPELVR